MTPAETRTGMRVKGVTTERRKPQAEKVLGLQEHGIWDFNNR